MQPSISVKLKTSNSVYYANTRSSLFIPELQNPLSTEIRIDIENMLESGQFTTEQIVQLIDSGLVEIGSHTMTHDNLPTLSIENKRVEIRDSKTKIEEKFKIKCSSFCYPFGLYDKEDVKIVKEFGYTNATITKKGVDDLSKSDLFELKRITVSGKDNLIAFKIKLKRGLRGLNK